MEKITVTIKNDWNSFKVETTKERAEKFIKEYSDMYGEEYEDDYTLYTTASILNEWKYLSDEPLFEIQEYAIMDEDWSGGKIDNLNYSDFTFTIAYYIDFVGCKCPDELKKYETDNGLLITNRGGRFLEDCKVRKDIARVFDDKEPDGIRSSNPGQYLYNDVDFKELFKEHL